MEPFKDDNDLIAELSTLRPAPRPAFTAELDERAAAGFPRRSPLGRLTARLQAIRPRRMLIPAGATALAAIAAVTVVVAVNEPGTDSESPVRLSATNPAASGTAGPSAGGESPGSVYESAVPSLAAPEQGTSSGASAGSAETDTGPFASKTANRAVERSAELILGADPADVAKDASRVFEAVHAQRGIVLRSSIRDGAEGEAGAQFDLLIPSARLGDALAAFSAIAEVRSRHEATADITAPTVRTGELLRDSRARIEGLLTQLAAADTEAERAAAETELRAERRHNAHLRSQLSTLERRASFSRVSLRIETGASAASEDSGGWGIDDALDDASHILAIAAGVAIVGLAIIAPLALIALLAWLANRTRIHRSRERALE